MPEPVVVWRDRERPGSEPDEAFARVHSDSPDELLRIVRKLSPSELETAIVAIDESIDQDTVIALAAVLVDCGVVAIETRYAIAVNRVFTTHNAIEAGSI